MKLKRLGVWVLTVLVGLEFCIAGLRKFAPSSAWPRMFLQWGFPSWVRPAIGVIEVVCGVAVFVPRARRPACAVLLCVMAGAAVTHLAHGEPRRVILPVALAVMLGLLRGAD